MDKISNIIGLDVYTEEGYKLDARDFINNAVIGYGVEQVDDIGYRAIPIGDSAECASGLCDLKLGD